MDTVRSTQLAGDLVWAVKPDELQPSDCCTHSYSSRCHRNLNRVPAAAQVATWPCPAQRAPYWFGALVGRATSSVVSMEAKSGGSAVPEIQFKCLLATTVLCV